jgi:hypothetical protein
MRNSGGNQQDEEKILTAFRVSSLNLAEKGDSSTPGRVSPLVVTLGIIDAIPAGFHPLLLIT